MNGHGNAAEENNTTHGTNTRPEARNETTSTRGRNVSDNDGMNDTTNRSENTAEERGNVRRNGETAADGTPSTEEETKRFYDEETRTFNATNLRNGDVPFRKRVTLPECSGPVEEAKLTLCREKLNEAMKKYKEGEQKSGGNLTKEQKRGLRKLRKRIKDKEIVCFQTDKSGAISIDTPQNYIESMRPHLEGTTESSEEEYERTEKLLNAHVASQIINSLFCGRIPS